MGTEIQQASPMPRLAAIGDAQRPAAEIVNPTMVQAKDLLRDIQSVAASLRGKSLEHRVEDFRDRIPIWANIRSHKLAGREGEQIENMHAMVRELRALVVMHNLPINIDRLESLIFDVKKPAGVSKWVATFFTGLRGFHRGWTADTLEEISVEAGTLLRPARPQYQAA